MDLDPVRHEAESFVVALAGAVTAPLTFQVFDDNASDGHTKDHALERVLHGTLAQHWSELSRLNRLGAGVYVMVNEGDGIVRANKKTCRTNENVASVRALFLDDDAGKVDPQSLHLKPSILVRSKRGLHVYWRLQSGEPLASFKTAQETLAATYCTDPLKDLARVLRLPGFFHMKDPADPFLVRIVGTEAVEYTIHRVLDGVPAMPSKPLVPDRVFQPPPSDSSFRRASAYLAKLPASISGARGHDALWAAAVAMVRGFRFSDGEAYSILATEYNPRCQPPWSEKELQHKVTSASGNASVPYGYLLDVDRPMPSRVGPRAVVRPEPPPHTDADVARYVEAGNGPPRDAGREPGSDDGSDDAHAHGPDPLPATPPAAATAPLSLGDLLAKLDGKHALGTLTHPIWCAELARASLGPADEKSALVHVGDKLMRCGRRAAAAEWKAYKNKSASKATTDEITEAAHGREVVEWRGTDLNKMARMVEFQFIKHKTVYRVDDSLVLVRESQLPGSHHSTNEHLPAPEVVLLVPLSKSGAMLKIDQSILFTATDSDGFVRPLDQPDRIAPLMLDLDDKRTPEIAGLVPHPLMLSSGRLLAQDGLDEDSGLYIAIGGWSLRSGPTDPTQADASRAASRIRELLLGDVLLRDRKLDGAAVIAMLLLGIARKGLPQAPAILINATIQGSGKTALAKVLHVILTGRDMPVSRLSDDPAEFTKTLLATLIRSPAMVCYDNIEDGSMLDEKTIGDLSSVLTASMYTARYLGVTKEVSAPTNLLFVFTGNNIGVGTDQARRILKIDLHSELPEPERRSFKHPDLLAYARSVRADVIECLLTIQRAWFSAGRPRLGPGLGFGPEFDSLITWPLAFCGEGSILSKFDDLKATSPAEQRKLVLLRALRIWQFKHGDANGEWTPGSVATDIKKASEADTERHMLIEAFGISDQKRISSAGVGRVLAPLLDNPPRDGLVLRHRISHHVSIYSVHGESTGSPMVPMTPNPPNYLDATYDDA